MRFSFANRVLGLLLLAAGTLRAQTAPAEAPTLHVYVNLVQIPVLVLDGQHRTLPPIATSDFMINLDGVKPFRPTKVRREDDDPLSLTILVDKSEKDEHLWERLSASSGDLVASLRSHDRVEIYGIDGCKLRRYLGDEDLNLAHLHAGLDAVTAAKSYAAQKKQLGRCAKTYSLWDAMLYTTSKLQDRPGRRILLVLSNGQSDSGGDTISVLHRLANARSVTIFGVQSEPDTPAGAAFTSRSSRVLQSSQQAVESALANPGHVDATSGAELQRQAEMSGGMLLGANAFTLSKALAKPIELARGRYILEFPRPAQLSAGVRTITVSVGKQHNAFIRPAGISFPIATDAETATDAAIEHGENKPLAPEPDATAPGTATPGTATPLTAAPQPGDR